MLILDEPTAGLDARSADEFLALIARLNSEDHLTIVCVTHDRQKHGNKQLQLGAAL
jgi:energy-coupling factor transporter ATP-binding protein EcfA2